MYLDPAPQKFNSELLMENLVARHWTHFTPPPPTFQKGK